MKATFTQGTKRWCVCLITLYTATNAIFCLILAIISKRIRATGIQLGFKTLFVVIQGVWVGIRCRTCTDRILWVWGIWRIIANQIRASLFIVWNAAGTCIELIRGITAASAVLIWTSLFIGSNVIHEKVQHEFLRWILWRFFINFRKKK